MAVQGDGGIVAAGTSGSGFAGDSVLARYDPDGSLDTTFDADGRVTTDFGGDDHANAVAVDAGGRILTAGVADGPSGGTDFALARYATDGGLDTTFDTDGKVTTDFTVQSLVELSVAKTHTGNFTAGRPGTYTVTVRNIGPVPTDGTPVTVNDSLPGAFTPVHAGGRGWRCSQNQFGFTCTRSDVLAPGSSYPPLTVRVRVDRTATGTVSNSVLVDPGGGDFRVRVPPAEDPTIIEPR
ncbi:hypothetical protein [Streptomyces sp. NPDC093225]|uniref:hypothetical protein n=1 Tax=Streptomyces sp. NPDC093225 TaxID=3366034 RepID=UPI00380BB97A